MMRPPRLLFPRPLCLVSLAALAACTVGPDFAPPAAPAAPAYLAADEAPGATAREGGVAPARWWAAYGSPALDALVDRAIARNPSIAASNATLARARAAVAAARGRALPQVDATARVQHEQVNLAAFGFGGGGIPGLPSENPEFSLYSVGGGVSYDLDLFGGRRRGIEQAAAQAEAQRRQTEAAHLALAGQVVTQAIELAAIRARLATADALIREDERNVDLTDKRRRGGEGTMVQVLSARSQLAADRALLPPLRQALSEARHLLAILVGDAPSGFVAPDFDL
ncbi:MAG TPA: TolC family protein, partial [Sphingomonadaceae bacterium]|nr:TolC family protein [Sphingomonadaceae bacterium]